MSDIKTPFTIQNFKNLVYGDDLKEHLLRVVRRQLGPECPEYDIEVVVEGNVCYGTISLKVGP